ncbi:WHG domain-containing protein [Kribbella sp. NPDC051587]|uniref:WHG domain-containing protein n=1 Tax=Kribbella sp. NPDC051587 TaxID=3364119 RepID=UPI00379908F7
MASALAVLATKGPAGLTTRAVAQHAGASVPAIYEVFGDKAGLIRAVFFEGFRLLGDELAGVESGSDPFASLEACCAVFRTFVLTNPVLAQIMFSRPFADFEPTPEDEQAGVKVREVFVGHARAAVAAGLLNKDPRDVAHLVFALAEGLSAAEGADRLGDSPQSTERRWRLGFDTLFQGLGPARRKTERAPSEVDAQPPAGFVPYTCPSPYLELIGPVYEAARDTLVAGLWLDHRHTNTRGLAHAGVLATLADTLLGHTVLRKHPDSPPIVTVSMTTDFVGSARVGQWLQGEAEVHRHGSRLSYASAKLIADDQVVMTASGVFASQPASRAAGSR